MRYLKFQNRSAVAIDKQLFTVGEGAGYDVSLPGLPGTTRKILFTLQEQDDQILLYPGEQKISINGKSIKRPVTLVECDRIEWNDQVALVLDEVPVASHTTPVGRPLQLLEKLVNASKTDFLGPIVEYAGAETGTIACENHSGSEWSILASHGAAQRTRKALLSHTLFNEAIRTREPVYIESIVGHQWESRVSILEAQVFSLACIPLHLGQDIFGVLFLSTKTPGKTIRKESLEELRVICTLATRLLSTISEHPTPSPTPSASFVFEQGNPENPMRGVFDRITKLSDHDLSILIRGETGTGKELVAREVHQKSKRAHGPFVALNCAAIPPSLMESLLFGYKKGAFTGANKDRPGKFAAAHKGTIFLDEIGDLSLELQTKLLRVIQEKEVEPIGADRPFPIDVRILSATHQDLETLVKEGKFRKDLYYRLNGANIVIPPLRSRGNGEIALLARHFLAKQSSRHELTEEALRRLQAHQWPGNVRELEQVISRALALSAAFSIQASDLELETLFVDETSESLEEGGSTLKEVQERFTKGFIAKILGQCHGNKKDAAEILGISERTLYRLLSPGTDVEQ